MQLAIICSEKKRISIRELIAFRREPFNRKTVLFSTDQFFHIVPGKANAPLLQIQFVRVFFPNAHRVD
jgi:hypothetical protein